MDATVQKDFALRPEATTQDAEPLPDVSRRRADDLVRQQKNSIIAEPIAALEADTNVKAAMAKRHDVEPHMLDLRFMALGMLDYIMEESAFRPGAEYDRIVDVGTCAVARMCPGLAPSKAAEVAAAVFDQIRNKGGRFGDFRIRYFDPNDASHRVHGFRYVESVPDPDDVSKTWIRLAAGGQKYQLGMLDIADDILDEAERIIVRKAFERSRFDDARRVANRSKIRSIVFKQDIDNLLRRARRDWKAVDWSGALGPAVEQAVAHLRERKAEDDDFVHRLKETAADLPDGSAERAAAFALLREVLDCNRIHGELLRALYDVGERYRAIVTSSFSVPERREARDPEREVFLPMLDAQIGRVAAIFDVVDGAMSAPNPPPLLHLRALFQELAAPEDATDPGTDEEADELPLEDQPPLFTPERLEAIEDWFAGFSSGKDTFLLSEALDAGADAGFSGPELRAVVLVCIAPLSVPFEEIMAPGGHALRFEISGRWTRDGIGGDEITFRRPTAPAVTEA